MANKEAEEDERNKRGFRVFNVLIGREQTCKMLSLN